MRKFKNLNDVSKLSLKNILLYKKELKNTLREIDYERGELEKALQTIMYELQYRNCEVEKLMKKIECIRLNATTPIEFIHLILH